MIFISNTNNDILNLNISHSYFVLFPNLQMPLINWKNCWSVTFLRHWVCYLKFTSEVLDQIMGTATSPKWMQYTCMVIPLEFQFFIKRAKHEITHPYVFTNGQHDTRFKHSITVSLLGKIYNLNTVSWK